MQKQERYSDLSIPESSAFRKWVYVYFNSDPKYFNELEQIEYIQRWRTTAMGQEDYNAKPEPIKDDPMAKGQLIDKTEQWDKKPARLLQEPKMESQPMRDYSSAAVLNDRNYLSEQCDDTALTYMLGRLHVIDMELVQAASAHKIPCNILATHINQAFKELRALIKDEMKNRIDKL